MRKNYVAGLILLSLMGAMQVSAQEVPTAVLADSYVRPEYVEIERIRHTKDIVVITKEQIKQRGYSSLSEVLASVPIINVNLTGNGDVDIRGQGADQATRNVQIMVDGAPITTLVNHPIKTDYNIVPIENIEKIEIIPGGGSVLYGSGTSGGVINITTNLRNIRQSPNTFKIEKNTSGNRLAFQFKSSINEKIYVAVGGTRQQKRLYFKDTYHNSKYAYAGIAYQDNNKKVTFRMSHLQDEGKMVGNVSVENLLKYDKNYVPNFLEVITDIDEQGHVKKEKRRPYLDGNRQANTYVITYQEQVGKTASMTTDLFYNKGYYSGPNQEKLHYTTKGIKVKLDYTYGMNNVLIGFDGYTQHGSLAYDDFKLVSFKKKLYKRVPLHFIYDKQIRGGYVLNVMNRNKWTYTQGIRRELTNWGFDKNGANNIKGNDVSRRYNTSAELSAAYQYTPTGRVFVRYERSYTVPDGLQITDQIKDKQKQKKYVPTTAKDEQFDLYELGWRDKIGVSAVNMTVFYAYTPNQMNRFYLIDKNGLQMMTMNNLATRRKGVELSLTQRVGKWIFSEAYAYLHGYTTYNADGEVWTKANPHKKIDYTRSGLVKVPRHKVVLNGEYRVNSKLSLGVTYTYVGAYNNFFAEADKNTNDGGIVTSHGVFDMRFRYKSSTGAIFYGGITNVGNMKYYAYKAGQGPASTIMPGNERAYYGGMSYEF